jgi:hypothetical protein
MQSSAAMSAQKSGAKPPLYSFRRMKETDLGLWASILCHQPPPNSSQPNNAWWSSYKHTTKDQIDTLPDHLRAYPSAFHRLLNRSQKDKTRAEARTLCPLHDKMNRALARSTLGWIKAEVDVNIPAVFFPLLKVGLLESDIQVYFEPLRDVTGMWTTPKKYQEAWGQLVKPKWAYQVDHCAACVLARFASDVNVVTAFKAGLIARRLDDFRKGRPSKRLSYVNHLISHFPNSESPNIKAEQMGKYVQRALEQFKENRKNIDQVELSYRPSVDARPISVSPLTVQFPTRPELRVDTQKLEPSKVKTDEYSPSVYSPTPIRPHASENMPRDVISQLIDQYRRTVWEPKLGSEDYSGFEADDPTERAAVANAISWNDEDEMESTAKDEASERDSQRTNPYSWDSGQAKRTSMRDTQFLGFF